jgi:hypothetical protein
MVDMCDDAKITGILYGHGKLLNIVEG